MANAVTSYILSLWTSRGAKQTPSGWFSANAPCCVHNKESADTRQRGGLLVNPDDSVAYSCFNCNFSTVYKPGSHLSFKFRKLLSWAGASELEIQRLVIDAIRIREDFELLYPDGVITEKEPVVFKPRELPAVSTLITPEHEDYHKYITDRKIEGYDLYFTSNKRLERRVIVPFYANNVLVGYTARAINGQAPKYLTQADEHYVFNLDKQTKNRKIVIVAEGPFDAMSVDGVAVLHNKIHADQADQIDSLCKRVIVVPDADPSGSNIVEDAITYGWSVSFPIWFDVCKDINAALQKYDKLYVMKAIVDAVENNPLKIKLKAKRLYGK